MEEIVVVYEKGVFKPLRETDLEDGTKAVVVVRHKGIADILPKFQSINNHRLSINKLCQYFH